MTSAFTHRRRVFETISPLRGSARMPLTALLHVPRQLAADVVSAVDVPAFDNSSMDGFAVAAQTLTSAPRDGSRLGPLPVVGQVAAGARGAAVDPGTVVEIMTGAPVPEGADTIIPIEATEPGTFGAREITVEDAPAPGAFVRARGSDVTAGTTVLRAGALLTPARLGVAAACGVVDLDVVTLPQILVLSTGDEIAGDADAGIEDANGITLTASLTRLGAEVNRLRVPDDPEELLRRVRAVDTDLVVSTGGISKGAREVVKLAAALDPEADMLFEPIAMQPGGPQGVGTLAGLPWVALPGNPVSALISVELFIRPALLGIDPGLDARPVGFHPLTADLDETPPAGKLQVRRAIVDDDGITLVGGSRSHLLHSYAESTHLVFIPPTDDPDDPFAAAGDRLRTWTIA